MWENVLSAKARTKHITLLKEQTLMKRIDGNQPNHLTRLTFLCLMLLVGGMACAPKMVGPTAPSGYVFSVIVFPPSITHSSASFANDTPGMIYQRSAELLVHVQDAQGHSVDGIPVAFQVESSWVQDASVSPSRVLTQEGKALARFQADIIGNVHVMVRVENTTQQVLITVNPSAGSSTSGI